MIKRPQDFYGPDDWSGGDPQDDIDRITQRQKDWDEANPHPSSMAQILNLFANATLWFGVVWVALALLQNAGILR